MRIREEDKVQPERVFKIPFTWTDCESAPSEPYLYPATVTSHMKSLYLCPCVYRWKVSAPNGSLEALYVGETENLIRRLKTYIRPSRPQTRRIQEHLKDALSKRMLVRLQFLQFENFIINSRAYGFNRLNDPFARKVVENLAIIEAREESDCLILNRGMNIIQKKLERFGSEFSEFPPEDHERLFNMPLALMLEQRPKRRRVTTGQPRRGGMS